MNYFDAAVRLTDAYARGRCAITGIEQTSISYDCWDQVDTLVVVVNVPCVIILVDVEVHDHTTRSNVTFYRNFAEKSLAVRNKHSEVRAVCRVVGEQ